MLMHHFATLFAIFFVGSALDKTKNPAYVVSALLWLFQATTEQSVFVGLLLCKPALGLDYADNAESA
jgi:hypothetical protein